LQSRSNYERLSFSHIFTHRIAAQPYLCAVRKALLIIFSVLALDQFVKVWIKTHMYLGESYRVSGEWFYLHFVENPGMAFGLQLGGDYGKLLLSVFRIIAICGIGYYLYTLSKKHLRPLLLVCVALVFTGALGNIVDSIFYGKLFGASDMWDQNVAQFLPDGGGYAGWLHGQVVDMFYFPVIEGTVPDWSPIWGGEEIVFFRPVFNIADAAISVGVFLLIIFQSRLFGPQVELSEKKIKITNAFFGVLTTLLLLFVLLTLTALFATEHPLAWWLRLGLFLISAGVGYWFYVYLQRYPKYMPEVAPEENNTPHEESSSRE